jgi:drug/metabolite transporter (DMT)-like permease
MAGRKDRAATLVEASLLLAVLFLGTNPVAVKVAVTELPPLPFVATRFILAGLLLLALVTLLEPAEGRPGRGTSCPWRVLVSSAWGPTTSPLRSESA